MKIIHIIKTDNIDGAGRAAFRLHSGLRQLGYDSNMFVAQQGSNDPHVTRFRPLRKMHARFFRRLQKLRIQRNLNTYKESCPKGYDRFSDDRSLYGSEPLGQLPAGDLINLHSIVDFIDYPSFFRQVPQHTPLIWTLHDMYPFTGGCHYDHGCGKYREECGACPQLGSDDPHDLSAQVWARKRRVFESISPERLHLVALNQWMAETVKSSALLGKFPLTIIPNSLDTQDFAPRERSFARQVLGIPPEARVVLFVSSSLGNRRKGLSLLVEALNHLQDLPNLLLLSIGRGKLDFNTSIPNLHLGLVQNDRLISMVYSVADVYVSPSLQDNLPNTLMEALACGTPVVGFDVGGIPDLIRPEITGLLAPARDTTALDAAIRRILDDETLHHLLANNCRQIACQEYTLEVQAMRYKQLYERILAFK